MYYKTFETVKTRSCYLPLVNPKHNNLVFKSHTKRYVFQSDIAFSLYYLRYKVLHVVNCSNATSTKQNYFGKVFKRYRILFYYLFIF